MPSSQEEVTELQICLLAICPKRWTDEISQPAAPCEMHLQTFYEVQ
jgi:hypothetical protein